MNRIDLHIAWIDLLISNGMNSNSNYDSVRSDRDPIRNMKEDWIISVADGITCDDK